MSYMQHSYQDVRAALSGDKVSWLLEEEGGPSRWDKSPARCIRSGDYWLFVQLQPDVSKLDDIDSPEARLEERPWLARLQALRARGLDAAALRSAGPPSLPHNRLKRLHDREPPHDQPAADVHNVGSKWSLDVGVSDPEVQDAEMNQRISDTLLDLEEQLRRRPHLQSPSPNEDECGLELDFTKTCKLDSQNYGELQTNMSCGAFKVLTNAVTKVLQNEKHNTERKAT